MLHLLEFMRKPEVIWRYFIQLISSELIVCVRLKGVEVLCILICICNSSSKRLGQEELEFEASRLEIASSRSAKDYIVRLSKKKKKKEFIIINSLSEMFCCSHNLLACYLWLVSSLYAITSWAHILSSISPKLHWSFWKDPFIHSKRLIVIVAYCIPIEARLVLDTIGMLAKKKSILKSW